MVSLCNVPSLCHYCYTESVAVSHPLHALSVTVVVQSVQYAVYVYGTHAGSHYTAVAVPLLVL